MIGHSPLLCVLLKTFSVSIDSVEETVLHMTKKDEISHMWMMMHLTIVEPCPMDHDDGISLSDQGSQDVDQISSNQQENSEPFTSPDAADDDRSERVDEYLF
ncbi:hypothetical protein HAX54_030294 [Datura stramonium]|uniref:Uncharacterized protein n=1 Tax=Datura stramonium TaxID=4076 RepID=A0ABS8SAY3_DATST|nr:hypothetical protein [Datura stramonium]